MFGVDSFLLKQYRNAKAFQFAYSLDAVQRIPRKSGNGFDKNPINLSVSAILEQTLKIVSGGCCRTRDGFISIQSGKLPVLFGLDDVGIVRNLRGEGIELVGGIAA